MIKGKNKITVIVNGRFHAFDYAYELNKAGRLHRLISTMPYSSAKKFNIPRDKYIGFPVLEILKVLSLKIFNKSLPTMYYARFFTKLASYFIPKNTDVIISFAGYSHEIFKSKKHLNKLKILDRGSCHTLSVKMLNALADKSHNLNPIYHGNDFINRELEEYELADKILIPSSYVESTFIDNGVDFKKLIKIPYSNEINKFKKFNNNFIREQNKVLYVGKLNSKKGIKTLVDSISLARKTNPKIELWLVGKVFDEIKPFIKDKEWIILFGSLGPEKLFETYAKASIFCTASYQEGLSLVLTEANYLNLPIVSTEVTGLNDIVKIDFKKYFTVQVGDSLNMSKYILQALDFKNEDSLKTENYTWYTFTSQLVKKIDLYEKIV